MKQNSNKKYILMLSNSDLVNTVMIRILKVKSKKVILSIKLIFLINRMLKFWFLTHKLKNFFLNTNHFELSNCIWICIICIILRKLLFVCESICTTINTLFLTWRSICRTQMHNVINHILIIRCILSLKHHFIHLI